MKADPEPFIAEGIVPYPFDIHISNIQFLGCMSRLL
jgi:hypothetical protein